MYLHLDLNKAGVEASSEVTEAAAALYQKLSKGYWWDGRKKRKINHDVTKLQYACDLTTEERNLVKDLQFLSGIFAGTQQVRLHIGHALFGRACDCLRMRGPSQNDIILLCVSSACQNKMVSFDGVS